jgi:hypothetical protein
MPTCDSHGVCRSNGVECSDGFGCIGDQTAGFCAANCATNGTLDDRSCASDYWCAPDPLDAKKGACKADLQLSEACSEPGQCSSGHCVDGVCCDQNCDGACEACKLSPDDPNAGQCRVVREGPPIGKNKVCGGEGVCAGSCNGTGRECIYPGSANECAKSSCHGNVETLRQGCDGAGRCAPQATHDCGGYSCDEQGSACKTHCASSADCASGAVCNPDSRECVVSGAYCKGRFTAVAADGSERSCPGRCDNGACNDACTIDQDCAPAFECHSGLCASGQNTGVAKSSNRSDGCGCRFAGVRGNANASGATWSVLLLLAWSAFRFGRGGQPGRELG